MMALTPFHGVLVQLQDGEVVDTSAPRVALGFGLEAAYEELARAAALMIGISAMLLVPKTGHAPGTQVLRSTCNVLAPALRAFEPTRLIQRGPESSCQTSNSRDQGVRTPSLPERSSWTGVLCSAPVTDCAVPWSEGLLR